MKVIWQSFTSTILILFAAWTGVASSQEKPEEASAERARANFAREIVLAPDDVRAFPDAPEGFRMPRADVPHGTIQELVYESAVTGTRRKANVYLPPGYSA